MIDYQSLLFRYMEHVNASEGTTFVDESMRWAGFSPDENAALVLMRNRIYGWTDPSRDTDLSPTVTRVSPEGPKSSPSE